MSKVYKVVVYVENAEGKMQPTGAPMQVRGDDADLARKAVRKLIGERDFPPVRTINQAADGTFLVYCAPTPRAVPVEEGMTAWNQPPGRGRHRL